MNPTYAMRSCRSVFGPWTWGETYGAITNEPKRMAALPPATVIVKGLRRMVNCSAIRDFARTEGINKDPTARWISYSRVSEVHFTHIRPALSDFRERYLIITKFQQREPGEEEVVTCQSA